MEEMKKFQSSTFDTIARRRLVEDQDTILELTGKIQVLQNEMMSRDFQDAESVRSGHSHVTSQPVSFPGGMLRPFYRNAEPQRRAAKHLGHAWHIGKRLCKSNSVFSAPYPQESNPWSSNVSEHASPHVMSESQSVVPSEGDSSKNYGADQQRLQIFRSSF